MLDLSSFEFRDPDMNDARKKLSAALDPLTAAQRERVLWVCDVIPRAWERVGHACSPECRPAIAAIEDGLVAKMFGDVVDDVVYWIGVRHAAEHPGETLPTIDERLDMIDKTSKWLEKRGVACLPKPIRSMLADAKNRIEIARRVAREMRNSSAA